MSDVALAALQKRVEDLTAENTTLKAENKDRRLKAKKGGEELDQLRKQVADLTTERDQFRTKAEAGPKELNDKIAGLEGQIRTRDHRDAFAGVKEFDVKGEDGKAKKYTLNDGVTIDAVWKQLDYKAEGETPKAEAISEQLGKARTAHPYLFKEVTDAAGAAQRPTTVQSREAGPGGGRGTSQTVLAAQGSQTQAPANYVPGRI